MHLVRCFTYPSIQTPAVFRLGLERNDLAGAGLGSARLLNAAPMRLSCSQYPLVSQWSSSPEYESK